MRGDEQMAQNELDIEFMNTTDLIKALHERIRDGHRFACWFDAGRGCWIMRVNNLDADKIADMDALQNELDIEYKNTTGLKVALNELIRDGHRFACWFDAGRGCWIMRVNNLDAHKIAHFEAFKHNAEPDPKPIE